MTTSDKSHIFLSRQQLLEKTAGRTCVCGESWSDNYGFYCNNKTCTYWNIVTNEHSVQKSRLDVLYQVVYQKGFCKCVNPQYHESIEDYEICLDCFKVLPEYEKVLIDESLYPRG